MQQFYCLLWVSNCASIYYYMHCIQIWLILRFSIFGEQRKTKKYLNLGKMGKLNTKKKILFVFLGQDMVKPHEKYGFLILLIKSTENHLIKLL